MRLHVPTKRRTPKASGAAAEAAAKRAKYGIFGFGSSEEHQAASAAAATTTTTAAAAAAAVDESTVSGNFD